MITKVSYTSTYIHLCQPCLPPTPDLDSQLAYMLEDDLGKDYETYLSEQPPGRAKAIKVTELPLCITAAICEGAEVDADVEGTGGGEGHGGQAGGGPGGVGVWEHPAEDQGIVLNMEGLP